MAPHLKRSTYSRPPIIEVPWYLSGKGTGRYAYRQLYVTIELKRLVERMENKVKLALTRWFVTGAKKAGSTTITQP